MLKCFPKLICRQQNIIIFNDSLKVRFKDSMFNSKTLWNQKVFP